MMKEITVDATVENIESVISFIGRELKELRCNQRVFSQICVAADEILCNIVQYAYPLSAGTVTVRLWMENPNIFCMLFQDSGIPYNPLSKEDPDVSLPASERPIGGLGIYLVKTMMDDLSYIYTRQRNNLCLKKRIAP